MSEFGGWLMPLEYEGGGALPEHAAVRGAVGVFDVSHMGVLTVTGDGSVAALNGVLTNDLERIDPGSAQYTLLCDESGGVLDDMIVYRRSDGIDLVTNAGNTEAVESALRARLGRAAAMADRSALVALIAVQGPRSPLVMEALGLPADLPFMGFRDAGFSGHGKGMVARSGYSGEVGYEVFVPVSAAVELWRRAVAAATAHGGRACGLASRDILRTEMGYPLYGHELSADISPLEAGLGWAIGWGKDRFLGKAALEDERRAGSRRRLQGLVLQERRIPRAGMAVVTAHGAGVVTSGTYSPGLGGGIALALLPAAVRIGDDVSVDIRGRLSAAAVVPLPFVDSNPRVALSRGG